MQKVCGNDWNSLYFPSILCQCDWLKALPLPTVTLLLLENEDVSSQFVWWLSALVIIYIIL